ncbi:MAG TPA: carbamoyltransferase HypF, partial [Methyloversatilis sp.]
MSTPLPTVLAVGAWLKNAACLLGDGHVCGSAVHGDLGDPQACEALDRSLHALLAQTARPVAAVAHDLHPDFYSTRVAVELAARLGVPAIGVQHHHAHIAAVMAEHGLTGPVIGLALDGVGLGTDGMAWGGELLWVAPGAWRRLGHLWPLQLAGGDVAAREPWRMAAAALH